MKAKFLMFIISFIFFIFLYSIHTYAITNEIETQNENLEDIQINISSKTEEDNKLIFEEQEQNLETKDVEEEILIAPDLDEIVSTAYRGTMFLENPVCNKTYTKPIDQKIKIQGWAVSNDSQATVRILLDGNILIAQASRTKRGDVDNIVSPSYGGASLTPNAGFTGELDINNLAEGRHTIRVEEMSRYGQCISSFEIAIHVGKKSFKGTMYLENPTFSKTFTRPTDAKIKIQGWAVSDDSQATIRVLCDGNILVNQTSRTKRGDVDKIVSPSYGGVSLTPNAGFTAELYTNQLAGGNHIIKIQEISRYGECIVSYETCIQIRNKMYKGTMYLENPTFSKTFTRPTDAKIKIQGWAVSDDNQATVRLLVDGVIIQSNIKRSKRGDVDQIISPNYGGVSLTPNAGFVAELPTGNLAVGKHKIRVEEMSRYGQCISSYETYINLQNNKYQGTMYLETPTYLKKFTRLQDTKMKVEGWAVSSDSKATVRILVDGKVFVNQASRIKRGDVDNIISPSYGGSLVTPNAGFSAEIDITCFRIGYHNLRVEEISRYGDIISVYEVQIQLEDKKYQGEMCIDAPTYNRTYNIGDNIAVAGWAVSQDEQAIVEIYIDGKLKARAERYYRGDVVYYINKYDGKTVNAGFGKLINSSGMTAGTHKITVYEKSRYGDIIGSVEVQILLKAPTSSNYSDFSTQSETPKNNTNNYIPDKLTSGSKGIDVSQHQGMIDWKKVANSGVQYAMIRIGYRGYGTGGFAEDTRFKSNFYNAVDNGLKVGVYFYSTSINTEEAKKDAEYVMKVLQKYGYQNKISMPIAIDLELIPGINTRDKNVTKSMRTSIANTFGQTIANYGYTPMIYACKSFLNDNMNSSQIGYDVWVAQYNSKCTYNGKYTMWQYTSTGQVSGINGNVDCNICYKNY